MFNQSPFQSLRVSIPFKRESVSQDRKNLHKPLRLSFNSLQTGKRITRHIRRDLSNQLWELVSIPFKRESVSQVTTTIAASYQVSIPFKRESVSQEIPAGADGADVKIEFQFPSNGKAYHKRPHFKPSGAVGPKAQKQTRSARGFFWGEILAPKSHKPACTLKQTRFFYKNGLEVKRPLGSWAFFAVPVHNRRIAYGVVIKYTRHLKKCQIFSNAPW